jgi:hypothetical protein
MRSRLVSGRTPNCAFALRRYAFRGLRFPFCVARLRDRSRPRRHRAPRGKPWAAGGCRGPSVTQQRTTHDTTRHDTTRHDTTRHDTHSVAGQTRGEAVRSSECRLYSRNATNGSTRVARRAGPYPAAAATGSSRAAIVPYVTGSVYWMAFQMNGYVATDCPRYCGRKPYSTTWPRPCLTSTSAALPLSFDPPRSQPDNSGLPVAG